MDHVMIVKDFSHAPAYCKEGHELKEGASASGVVVYSCGECPERFVCVATWIAQIIKSLPIIP